jgi:hypothetical protein
MNNSLEFNDRLNSVFICIEDSINDDNIISEEDFRRIQELKKELNITSENICNFKKTEIERILYLQFYLLFLDDKIDINERKEVEYYKIIFGYNDDEIQRIVSKVNEDKKNWANRMHE